MANGPTRCYVVSGRSGEYRYQVGVNVTRNRKHRAAATRLLVGLIAASSGLFAFATILGSAATPGAEAQTTNTTTYAPTPTTAPPTTAAAVTTTTVHPLAVTGTNIEAWVVAGAAAIAVGGLIVLGVRARRHRVGYR
jgi:hypothetical protein